MDKLRRIQQLTDTDTISVFSEEPPYDSQDEGDEGDSGEDERIIMPTKCKWIFGRGIRRGSTCGSKSFQGKRFCNAHTQQWDKTHRPLDNRPLNELELLTLKSVNDEAKADPIEYYDPAKDTANFSIILKPEVKPEVKPEITITVPEEKDITKVEVPIIPKKANLVIKPKSTPTPTPTPVLNHSAGKLLESIPEIIDHHNNLEKHIEALLSILTNLTAMGSSLMNMLSKYQK